MKLTSRRWIDPPQEPEKVEITINGEKRLVRDKFRFRSRFLKLARAGPKTSSYVRMGAVVFATSPVDGVKKPACQTRIR